MKWAGEGAGFSDCQFRKQKEPGSGFLRRRASDELAGGKDLVAYGREQEKKLHDQAFPFTPDHERRSFSMIGVQEFVNREDG